MTPQKPCMLNGRLSWCLVCANFNAILFSASIGESHEAVLFPPLSTTASRRTYIDRGRHHTTCAITRSGIGYSEISIEMNHFPSGWRIRRVCTSCHPREPRHAAHALLQVGDGFNGTLTLLTLCGHSTKNRRHHCAVHKEHPLPSTQLILPALDCQPRYKKLWFNDQGLHTNIKAVGQHRSRQLPRRQW